MAEIRRKTGILDTRKAHHCREYLQKYAQAMEGEPRLSTEMVQAIRATLRHETPESITYTLQISKEELNALLFSASQLAGIFTADARAIRTQWRVYLALNYPIGAFPPVEQQLAALRMLVGGASYLEIATKLRITEKFARDTAKDACTRLGLNARGRGTQRQLLSAYFAQKDSTAAAAAAAAAPAIDPMADDCF